MAALAAAVPALLVVLAGWAFGLDPQAASDVAMVAALLNLLGWQLALLVPEHPGGWALLAVLALDAAVIGAQPLLRLTLR